MRLHYCTSNENKFREAKIVLGDNLIHAKIDLPEIQSMSLSEIANQKAIDAFEKIKEPLIVEDIGLFVDNLKGFPGPLIKWVNETMGYNKFGQLFGTYKASWDVAFTFYDGQHVYGVTASAPGYITYPPRGDSWGFEAIFTPENSKKTVSEMTIDDKRTHSPRFIGLEKLKNHSKLGGLLKS